MFKNPPCNAGHGDLIPGGRTKISHATRQLSSSVAVKTQHRQKKKKERKKIEVAFTYYKIPSLKCAVCGLYCIHIQGCITFKVV